MLEPDDDKINLVLALNYQCYDTWCTKAGVSRYDKRFRYISGWSDLRGYSPQKLRLIYICTDDWTSETWLRFGEDEWRTLRMYQDLGAEVIYDTCIVNPPTRTEREEWYERRRNG